MITILVDQLTERIKYCFQFVFEEHGHSFHCTNSLEEFESAKGPKLNYSSNETSAPAIVPSGLLYDTSIFEGVLEQSSTNVLRFDGKEDVLASVFYVLTRMEEYHNSEKDQHDRFPFDSSCLSRFNWIEQAVCDRWSEQILQMLDLEMEQIEQVDVIPSFDIDNTYAYKLKEGSRRLLSTARDILKTDAKRIRERKAVKRGERDPYDTFDRIKTISNTHPNSRMFWLVKSKGEYDRNVDIERKEHQDLIEAMSQSMLVNIHPSYASFGNSTEIQKEIVTLENIVGKTITESRQHFLRFRLPDSYRALIDAGIQTDFSMGFAEHCGFRSGTAREHYWFDLERNEVTGLKIRPFVYMDGTLNEYMKLSVEEAKLKIKELYKELQQYGGDFIFIWHNETIGDYGHWNGWSDVLEHSLSFSITHE